MDNPLKALGNLNQMRKQAQIMQRLLSQESVSIEHKGVYIEMSGDQKIKELTIDGKPDERIAKAIEKAISESQKMAAKKLAGMSGGLGGLLGGN